MMVTGDGVFHDEVLVILLALLGLISDSVDADSVASGGC